MGHDEVDHMTTDTPAPSQATQKAQHAATRRTPVWWIRWLVAWAGRLLLAAVAMALVAAEAFTDHHHWSQWLFWAPREAYLLATIVLACLTIFLEPAGPRRFWARLGPIALACLVLFHTIFIHWRWHNAVRPRPGNTELRVYHWNATEATDEALQDFLRSSDPFALRRGSPACIVIVNPPLRLDWPDIVRMLAADDIPMDRMPDHLRRGGRFIVLSGPVISQSGWTSLELRGITTDPGIIDDGAAVYITVDPGLGTTTIWGIDWPSDPHRTRAGFVGPSLQAIDDSAHVRYHPTAAGPLRREVSTGFPRPDIAVGDFNTGRRSAAVSALLPGMIDVHDRVGVGPDYTWPRFMRLHGKDTVLTPFLSLDQAWVRPGTWRARAYRTHDLGAGTHLAQEIELTPDR